MAVIKAVVNSNILSAEGGIALGLYCPLYYSIITFSIEKLDLILQFQKYICYNEKRGQIYSAERVAEYHLS